MIGKLLLLAALVVAVLLMGRIARRLGAGGPKAGDSGPPKALGKPQRDAADLERCTTCGTYVADGQTPTCGRADCPRLAA